MSAIPTDSSPELPPVIDVQDLHKAYGGTRALQGVSLRVERGSTVALIGPNGAGKSTLVEILMGLRSADAGRVHVLGHDVLAEPRAHVQRIGVQLQETRLFSKLRVIEYLRFFAQIYEHHVDIAELLARMKLTEVANTRIDKLSGGQRQRVALALALVNDPELVILDEPSVGLDPIVRREFWELIRELRHGGKTVLFTTHYMDEAQSLADSVLMIAHGRLVAAGSPSQLIASSRTPSGTLDDAYFDFANRAQPEAA
jgi:ABC-2 type transport system ATP-binding protein